MNARSTRFLTTLVLTFCGLVCPLRAATVTAGSITTVSQGGVAPGSSANYYFFGGGAQPNNQTTFTLTTPPPSQFDGKGVANYPTLQPPGGGTVFTTGIGYAATTTTAATSNLATFTTGALTGNTYSVYVLFGNTNLQAVQDASIGLSINNGAFTTVNVTDAQNTDNFVRFDITGAASGDTLTIDATATATATGGGGGRPYIGGVTFTTPVPEPATWLAGAFCLGVGSVALRRRYVHA